jgi:tRNA(Ile)-lysidine synthase
LGHTADDQLETFLMWILRGAGTTGLGGMPYEREGLFVRPLLDTTREELLAYLEASGFSYRTDSSNLSARYRRNQIRQELVPVVKRLMPGVAAVVRRQMNVLREDDRCLDRLVEQEMRDMIHERSDKGLDLDHRRFLALPLAIQRRVIRQVFRELDARRHPPPFLVVERVVRHLLGRSGNNRPCGWGDIEVVREAHVVHIRKTSDSRLLGEDAPAGREVPVSVPSTVQWPPTAQQIEFAHVGRRTAEQAIASRSGKVGVFDADRISSPLRLRTWRAGDRFCPAGMGGRRKKLQDFFVNIKLDRKSRHWVPLLVAPEGILWVVGRRQDDRFVVRPSTRRFMLARVRSS